MKSNALLKWLLVPVLLLAVWVWVRHTPGHPTSAPPRGATGRPLSPAEMADLGIPADTPRDTVATLVGQVQHLRADLEASLRDNREQKADNTALRQRLAGIDARVEAALQRESEHWERLSAQDATDASEAVRTQGRIDELSAKVDALTGGEKEPELPIGLGLRQGDTESLRPHTIRWVEPLGPRAKLKTSSPTSTPASDSFHFASGLDGGDATDRPSGPDSDGDHQEKVGAAATRAARSTVPVYTVPANSTLMGSVAMTALIGRIPVDGTVEDPYPFKVLVGPDNLTANGIDLPNVAGAVMSGTASGDWTLSCVRGRITSVTFVFQDGTVRTVPGTSGAGSNGEAAAERDLGWISDSYGIPCVSGARRSNARQYLSSQMLITAAGAGAASLIRSQNGNFSYVAGSNGTSLGTVGISGNEAMGRILSGGVEEMSQWVNKLYGQAFAAIYVPPGAHVAVHIVRPINIDYDPNGRRVHYEGGLSHAPDLD